MSKSILVVVDYQKDFCDGKLTVVEAKNLNENIQREINNPKYDKIIYTFDSHTVSQYNGSREEKLFPNIHCEFGTEGWNLYKISPKNRYTYLNRIKNMQTPESFIVGDETFIMKPVFNVWEKVWSLENKFMTDYMGNDFNDEIYVCGVATDFCVYDCINGLIINNFKNINVLTQCIKGINGVNCNKQKLYFEERGVKYI